MHARPDGSKANDVLSIILREISSPNRPRRLTRRFDNKILIDEFTVADDESVMVSR